jgi:diguanylate cyclase (GGDEF)-like protein
VLAFGDWAFRERLLISAELKQELQACKALPSPPGVATRIIALANDPDADMDQIAKVLAVDPATTTKILRIANSAMYAMQRKTQNLRQALLVLGLNATISLALSFSLLKSWQSNEARGLDYTLFWRRALLAATASRVLANVLGVKDSEELFLTALIQDIGVMALDRAIPDLYAGIGKEQVHQEALIARERERLGADHSEIGGWLLEKWSFPDRIRQAVAKSHRSEGTADQSVEGAFTRCVALASLIAEVFLENSGERNFQRLAEQAEQSLGIGREGLGELIAEVSLRIPDAEGVFQTEILSASSAESILEEARETLMVRNLQALRTVHTLQDQANSLEQRTRQLEESSRRDPLTGLYNRSYLDTFVRESFEKASRTNSPLSVAFADLDKFKSVNDTYGHGAGDQILVTTANILKASVRGADIVARYGGEEFILVFPDTDYVLVKMICERIVKSLRETRHDVGEVCDLAVTISVGMATHNDGRTFSTSQELINAADKALYTAKLQGRNRSVPFESVADSQIAYM